MRLSVATVESERLVSRHHYLPKMLEGLMPEPDASAAMLHLALAGQCPCYSLRFSIVAQQKGRSDMSNSFTKTGKSQPRGNSLESMHISLAIAVSNNEFMVMVSNRLRATTRMQNVHPYTYTPASCCESLNPKFCKLREATRAGRWRPGSG